ncbi:MAG: hypothetical protein VX589_10500 [Myxococcota bacterium]|nr:hypothetical protein [Myxococcota bacterium]
MASSRPSAHRLFFWVLICGCAWFVGCAPDEHVRGTEAMGDDAHPRLPDQTCSGFFGAPNENSGLSEAACTPRIGADNPWTPPAWTAERLAALRAWRLRAPSPVPTSDPYGVSVQVPGVQQVCAVLPSENNAYGLETFDSVEAADAMGGIVTHGGACGLCSSLADLAAYAETVDLTAPVRTCGLAGGLDNDVLAISTCIEESVGFTAPCARIWAYNTLHTRAKCLAPCIELLDAPYLQSDGRLNACLQCDEDESGPVFKSIAGRTRRNSGLATALCRPCETVWRLNHDY